MKLKSILVYTAFFTMLLSVNCNAEEIVEEDNITISENSIVDDSIDNVEYGYKPIDELPEVVPYKSSMDTALGADTALGGVTPSYYNAIGEGLVAPFKDQGRTTLCWAFSTCGTIETNLAKQGYSLESLSPYYLAKATMQVTDYNDGIGASGYINNTPFYASYGSFLQPLSVLRRGHGLQPMVTQSSILIKDDKILEDNDLPYELNDYQIYRGLNSFDSYKDYESTLKLIKENIIKYGSAYMSIKCNYDGLWQTMEGQYYLSYCDTKKEADHSVQVIGYDDKFQKETFSPRIPKHDGAFICKQTFGIADDHSTIFYVPYDDMSIEIIAFLSVKKVTPSVNQAAYFGAAKSRTKVFANKKPCSFFMVYKNTNNYSIAIDEVSADLYMYGYNGDVQIYKNPKIRKDAHFTNVCGKECFECASGEPMLKKPVQFSNYAASLQRVKLPSEVIIKPGEYYQVVFTIYNHDTPSILNDFETITYKDAEGMHDDFLDDKLYGDIYVAGQYCSDENVDGYNSACLTKSGVGYPIYNNMAIQAYYRNANNENNSNVIKYINGNTVYNIRINLDNGEADLPSEIRSSYKISKPTKTGYKFKYWELNGKKISKITLKKLRRLKTDQFELKAVYTPHKYKIHYLTTAFEDERGVKGENKTQVVKYDQSFRVNCRLYTEGYIHMGWKLGDNIIGLDTDVKNLTIYKDVYLTPIWKKVD